MCIYKGVQQQIVGSSPALYITKQGALDSQPHVIKSTSCLPMDGGSLRVLWLPPPLKLIASCESSAPCFVMYKAGLEPTPYW
jgi:hypothetical protein